MDCDTHIYQTVKIEASFRTPTAHRSWKMRRSLSAGIMVYILWNAPRKECATRQAARVIRCGVPCPPPPPVECWGWGEVFRYVYCSKVLHPLPSPPPGNFTIFWQVRGNGKVIAPCLGSVYTLNIGCHPCKVFRNHRSEQLNSWV